jgi:dTDP-4-amino-4,6-dideoxygalactose transaminase
MKFPFVKPPITGKEEEYFLKAFKSGHHSGGGPYTIACQNFIQKEFSINKTLLTTSCTDALEMASFLINGNSEDEFIVPSYTFSSTANAFVSRGMTPVFCEIDEKTLNIDVKKIEALITNKTKAIVPIHYAGIPSEMDEINKIASKYKLVVIEDAAQAFNSKYKNKYAGSIGDLSTFSFHSSKSYSCGEGGALNINNPVFKERSEFLWEKGTDRSLVTKGLKNKYSWVDYGSSFLPSDLLASILLAQFDNINSLQSKRKKLFNSYDEKFRQLEGLGLQKIIIPKKIQNNFHAFWVIFPSAKQRDLFIEKSHKKNISPYIGYVPLHNSKMGEKVGKTIYKLKKTESISSRIVRLPFYIMSEIEIELISNSLYKIAKECLIEN